MRAPAIYLVGRTDLTKSAKIIFAGSGEFGLPSLKAIIARGHKLLCVVSQPDRPAGRGRKLTPTPIAQYALANNLPLIRTDNINAEKLPPADLLVVIAFGQKIGQQVVQAPRLGAMNLHSSLLPKCRGAAPINWTIIRGETVTGNSIIRLAEKMDAGDILAQSRLEIGETETAGELHDRLAEDGANLILGTIDALLAGTANQTPQEHSQASIAPKLTREHTRLDFAGKGAAELCNLIRGLYPWPGCRVKVVDPASGLENRLTLVRAKPVAGERTNRQPGEIADDGTICVGSGSEAIAVLEVQPEGKGVMSLGAYRNGHPWRAGMRVESVVS